MNVYMITVGTSLFENFIDKDDNRKSNFLSDRLDIDLNDKSLNLNSFQLDTEINDIIEIVCDIYEKLNQNTTNPAIEFKKFYNPQENNGDLSKWLTNIDSNKSCAELKTLNRVLTNKKNFQTSKQNLENNDKIILFPTLTLSGLLVSSILTKYLQEKHYNVSTIFTSDLGSTNNKNFKEGLKKFLENLYIKVIEYKNKNYKVYILASGGYKSIIPYCTIVGLLSDTSVYYIYEKSDNLVELPPLPIGIQKELFKPYAHILKILQSHFDKDDYNILPQKLQNLFIEKDGKIEASEFFKIAFNIYEKDFFKAPLQVESEGMSILKNLDDEYINYFKKIVQMSPYLWIGDKVPELVDHGLYHHDNLFVIADRVLSLIDQNNKNILESLDIFLILSTIFFHDWGHVVGHIEGLNRNLLPTEIRDFHNILSYKRIKKEKGRLLKEIFKINNNIMFEESYLYPIALLSAYHRKVMPLQENEGYFNFPLEKNCKFEPLKKQKCNFSNIHISGDKLIFLESLFRVIDSLDTQYVRTGSIDELIFKFKNFKMEIEEEEKKIQNLSKIITSEKINCYETIYRKLKNSYQSRANKPSFASDFSEFDEINKNLEEDALMFLYIESKLRIMMKDEQRVHFLKHLKLDIPEITGSPSSNNDIIITVRYAESSEFDKNITKIKKAFPEDEIWISNIVKQLTCENLVDSIRSEYDNVEDILKKAKIYFDIKTK